jgi:hypothetical protein
VRSASFNKQLEQSTCLFSHRRSKIKCVNTGKAPCRKCQRSGIPDCNLSRPQSKTPRKTFHRVQRAADPPASSPQPSPGHEFTRSAQPARHSEVSGHSPRHATIHGQESVHVDSHIASLSPSLVLKALNIFTNKFPELGILHLPSFMQEFQTSCHNDTKTLLAAILSVTQCYYSQSGFTSLDTLLSREQYASYAREMLSQSSFQAPKLQVAQALLVMGLFEWGSREFHRAWIYCGKAYTYNSVKVLGLTVCRNRNSNHAGNQQPSDCSLSSRPTIFRQSRYKPRRHYHSSSEPDYVGLLYHGTVDQFWNL